MNKKLLIITGILIALLTAIVLLQIWGIKSNLDKDALNEVTAPAAQESSVSEKSSGKDQNAGVEEMSVNDEEINGLETDLNSINDEDFSENTISDTEVGL